MAGRASAARVRWPAGPMPARLAKSLVYPSRKEFLDVYKRRTAWVRALYDRVVPA